MKSSILSQYQDLKKEANDIARRITKYRNVKALEDKYKELYDKLISLQLEIETKIEALDSIERMIVRYRYIDGMQWERISKLIHYSQSQTLRIHKKILNKIK